MTIKNEYAAIYSIRPKKEIKNIIFIFFSLLLLINAQIIAKPIIHK